MKTKQNYWYRIVKAFFDFTMVENRDRIGEEELISILKMTEKEESMFHENKSGGLWFRFGDDTIIYTIQNIENDLDLLYSSKNNHGLLIEKMKEAINSDPDYLQINFS